jgi:CBS domain containing-hemolysin-like protein
MDPDESSSIFYLILTFLLLFSGFFSGAEVALVSLSQAKARYLQQQKKRGAKAVEYLKNNPERLLITILVGNNVVNILIPVLSTVVFTNIFGNEILGLLTGILTIILLIFGEIVPKTLAQKHAEQFSLIAGPVIYFLSIVLTPIIWLIEKLLHVLGAKSDEQKSFTDEELIALAEIGEQEGKLESDERQRIEGVLEFGETVAEEVMTPRPEMDVLVETTTLEEAVQFFLEKTHSRIPVFSEQIDNITGILTLKNILKFEQDFKKTTPLSALPQNPPLTVPVSMPLEEVLKEMKWKRTHIAIVIDEHGGTAGLVTLEDLLEEVFGEIEDETDERENQIKKLPDGSYFVPAQLELEQVEEQIGIKLKGDETDRVAKLVLDTLGRFPKRGERVSLSSKIDVVIEKMVGYKIISLRMFVKKLAPRKQKKTRLSLL